MPNPLEDPPTYVREPITAGDIETMLDADGTLLLALVLSQILCSHPGIFNNAGGGSADYGKKLHGACLDRLSLLLTKSSQTSNGVNRPKRAL